MTTTPALHTPMGSPDQIGFVRIYDMNMAPAFRRGDYAAYRKDAPIFIADGQYVLETLPGSYSVYRVQRTKDGFKIWQDNTSTFQTVSADTLASINRGIVVGAFLTFDAGFMRGEPVVSAQTVPVMETPL